MKIWPLRCLGRELLIERFTSGSSKSTSSAACLLKLLVAFTSLTSFLDAQDQNPNNSVSTYVFAQAGELPIISRESNDNKPIDKSTVRVAVFIDTGVLSQAKLMSALALNPALKVSKLSGADVRNGKLNEQDVLILPGGSGSKQGTALGDYGRERVREFVRGGKGLIGICAGTYLITCDYDWSLNLLDAKVIDRKHWNRGTGNVDIALTQTGRKVLGVDGEKANIYYGQGPLLAPADNPDIPDFESLAVYAGEIVENNAPRGVMLGTTAIARCQIEKGRVFCFSPHPEKTPGLESMVLHAIDWVHKSDGNKP